MAVILLSSATGCDETGPGGNDEANGAEVAWTYKIWSDSTIDTVQPVIGGERVYVTAADSLLCLDLETGKQQWGAGLGVPVLITDGLLQDGESIFAQQSHNWVRAYDKQTGRLRWETQTPELEGGAADRMAQTETHLFSGGFGEVAIPSQAIRVRKNTGQIDKRYSLETTLPEGARAAVYNPAVTEDGWLYVPTRLPWPSREFDEPTKGVLFAFDTQSDSTQWKRSILPDTSGVWPRETGGVGAAVEGNMAVFAAQTRLLAFDRFSGEKLWEKRFPHDRFFESLTLNDGVAYIGSVRGFVYALDLASGEILWQQDTDCTIGATPVAQDGRIYATNDGCGEAWILDADSGEALWHAYPPEHGDVYNTGYLSAPAVGNGYMVIVGSRKIYGLKLHK